jgi:hypothetical protein
MKFHVSQIKWETDGAPSKDLPRELVIELDNVAYVASSADDLIDAVIDKVSDSAGWGIESCGVEADADTPPDWLDVGAFNRKHSPDPAP